MKKKRIPALLKFVRWLYPRLETILPAVAHRFFVTIFFTPLNYRVPEKEKVLERQAGRFRLVAGNKTIQCYTWGQGPVVLVVHGWAGRATQFRKIIPALVAAQFRVVGFDGPAHGKSSGRSTNIMEFEQVLNKLYDRVGVPEAIIAHSFGGGAVLYAAMNGLAVRKLINIATPTIGEQIIATYLRNIRGSEATARFFASHILKTTGKSFDEFTALHFIKNIRQKISLMLVHDREDEEVPIVHALELMKHHPAVLVETEGLGHTRILRDESVIQRCVSFIKG